LEILEERFQKGSVIFTSQVDPSGWHPLFEDPAVVEAILDRIQNPSIKAVLKGQSYRTQLGQATEATGRQKEGDK
jgi:DNA replication protein DnaC